MPSATIYAFDSLGSMPANFITGEQHLANTNVFNNRSFVIPASGPFFGNSLLVSLTVNGTTNVLVSGVDYFKGLPFIGATRSIGVPIYGSIILLNPNVTGIVSISYRTLGGPWVVSDTAVLKVISDNNYNPVITSFEQIGFFKVLFPNINNVWSITDKIGESSILSSLNEIEQNILISSNNAYNHHLSNFNNPHSVDKTDIGLNLVQDYGPASLAEAVAGVSTTTLITPATLKYALDNTIRATAAPTSAPTPSPTGAPTPAPTSTPTAAPTPAPTSAPTPAPTPTPPTPSGTLLYQQCIGYNSTGTYADGNYGTYTNVITYNSPSCGYVPPPSYGTLLSQYCRGVDLIGTYADGIGGTFIGFIAYNSASCGYVPPAPTAMIYSVGGLSINNNNQYIYQSDGTGFNIDIYVRGSNFIAGQYLAVRARWGNDNVGIGECYVDASGNFDTITSIMFSGNGGGLNPTDTYVGVYDMNSTPLVYTNHVIIGVNPPFVLADIGG